MRRITCAIAGLGNRGNDIYGNYEFVKPEEMKVVAIAEPLKDKREAAKKRIELLRKAYDWNNFNRYPDSCNYDDIIVEKYKKFIDSIAPQKFKYGYSLEQDLELEKQRETWV